MAAATRRGPVMKRTARRLGLLSLLAAGLVAVGVVLIRWAVKGLDVFALDTTGTEEET